MADKKKEAAASAAAIIKGGTGEEEEKLLEGVTVLDFDVLCATVAMQTQGKWRKFDGCEDVEEGEFGGVTRMWEGALLDCFDDRRIALQSACCPCYRFGKNMGRTGFGSCYLQGIVYLVLAATALINCVAFVATKKFLFLYLGVVFAFSVATYLGYYRALIRKKFNIRDSDRMLDDCVFHLICPSCTLCQESRTLEINNVQDGTWHGRGDTICIGAYSEGSKTFFELQPPSVLLINPPEPCTRQVSVNIGDSLQTSRNLAVTS